MELRDNGDVMMLMMMMLPVVDLETQVASRRNPAEYKASLMTLKTPAYANAMQNC